MVKICVHCPVCVGHCSICKQIKINTVVFPKEQLLKALETDFAKLLFMQNSFLAHLDSIEPITMYAIMASGARVRLKFSTKEVTNSVLYTS